MSFQPENFLTSSLIHDDVGRLAAEARLDLAAEVLHRFGEVRFVAHGSSMVPSIYPGDLLTVRSEASSSACCGEIVLCLVGGRFLVHRLMRKWPESDRIVFATRGDALAQEDPSVDGSQLLGRVISIMRRGKSVDFSRGLNPWIRLVRWGVRNSSTFTEILLAAHLLPAKIFRSPASAMSESPSQQFQEFA